MQIYQQLDGNTGSNTSASVTLAASSTPTRYGYVLADISNTDNIGIGPTNSANAYQLSALQSYLIQTPSDLAGGVDLVSWYAKSNTANQVYHVVYL